MEKNLSDEIYSSKRVMSWNDATNYFNSCNSGSDIKQSWTKENGDFIYNDWHADTGIEANTEITLQFKYEKN